MKGNLWLRGAGAIAVAVVAASCGGGGDGGDGGTGVQTGRISGSVTSSGTGVANASLALNGGGTTTTAANGSYSFDNVATGSRTVTLTVPTGFQLASGEAAAKSVTVTANGNHTLNFSLQPVQQAQFGTIQGTVTSGTGGVSGALITLAAGNRTANTAANGTYSFTNVPTGATTVTLTVPSGFNLGTGETAAKSVTVAANGTHTVNWSLTTAGGGGGSANVNMSNLAFVPQNVTISSGGTVRWTNLDLVIHTATANGGAFDTGNLSQNQSRTITFNSSGTFAYHCVIHPEMTGTVTVQ